MGGFLIYNLTNVATRAIRAPMKTSIPPRLAIKRNPRTSRMMPHAGLEILPAPINARTPTRMLTIALVKKSRDGTRGARFRRPLMSPLSWRTASRISIIPPITRSSRAIDPQRRFGCHFSPVCLRLVDYLTSEFEHSAPRSLCNWNRVWFFVRRGLRGHRHI